MRFHSLFITAGIALSGCGGATTSTGPMVTNFQVVDQFVDGTGVARVEALVDGAPYDFVVRANSVATRTSDDIPQFDLTGASVQNNQYGNFYVLPPSTTKGALSRYFVTTNEAAGIFAAGSGADELLGTAGPAFTALPSGTATISGFASFIDYRNVISRDGSFDMALDFGAGTATLNASAAAANPAIPVLIFTTGPMQISPTTGAFSTDTATVTRLNGGSTSGTFNGQLHSNAAGVSGLGYDNAASPTVAVAIAGER